MLEQFINLIPKQTFDAFPVISANLRVLRRANVYANPDVRIYFESSTIVGTPTSLTLTAFKEIESQGVKTLYPLTGPNASEPDGPISVVITAGIKGSFVIRNCPDNIKINIAVVGGTSPSLDFQMHASR